MASEILAPPVLISENYDSWRKQMKFWEMATRLKRTKRAPTIFLCLTGKAHEAILEMDPEIFNQEDGIIAFYVKLDNYFLVNRNLATLMAYESFESYARSKDTPINDYLIEFYHLVARYSKYVCQHQFWPIEPWRVLISNKNERLIKATVEDLKLDAMSIQLWEIISPTTPR